MTKCQENDPQSNSFCDNNDCLSLCNNLNLKTTDGLIRYRDRGNADLSDEYYNFLGNQKEAGIISNNSIILFANVIESPAGTNKPV